MDKYVPKVGHRVRWNSFPEYTGEVRKVTWEETWLDFGWGNLATFSNLMEDNSRIYHVTRLEYIPRHRAEGGR